MNDFRPIILLTHEYFPQTGGIATYCEELAGAARRDGIDITVWAAGKTDSTPETMRMPHAANQDWTTQWRLCRFLIRRHASWSAARLHLAEPGPLGAWLWMQMFRRFREVRPLITFHGSEIEAWRHSSWRRLALRRLLGRCEAFSTLTRHVRDMVLKTCPAAADRWIHGPGAPREACVAAVPPPSPRQSGKASDHRIVLAVGRIHPRKGQAETARALSFLPEPLRSKTEFWIAGDGEKHGYRHSILKAAGDRVRIRWLGRVSTDELIGLYDQADLLACPSLPFRHSVEGFGLAVVEAGARGLPAVGSRIGGLPEAVIDGETGLLVPAGDTAALSGAIHQLLSDDSLRLRLGDNARRRNLALSWSATAHRLYRKEEIAPKGRSALAGPSPSP